MLFFWCEDYTYTTFFTRNLPYAQTVPCIYTATKKATKLKKHLDITIKFVNTEQKQKFEFNYCLIWKITFTPLCKLLINS